MVKLNSLFSTLHRIALCQWWKCECESGMNWRQGWSGLFSLPLILCLSVHSWKKKSLLNPAGNFLLCSRPLDAPGYIHGLFQVRYGYGFWIIILVHVYEIFVCRCRTRVLTVSKWVRWTLELHNIAFSKPKVRPLSSFLLLIRPQSAFLSCESEDRGHWLNFKSALDSSLIQGSGPYLHTYIQTHNAPPIPLTRDTPFI